jgi:hypothetical protein
LTVAIIGGGAWRDTNVDPRRKFAGADVAPKIETSASLNTPATAVGNMRMSKSRSAFASAAPPMSGMRSKMELPSASVSIHQHTSAYTVCYVALEIVNLRAYSQPPSSVC